MALQVTSSTLNKTPDKLLNKGASYFRERTNTGILRTSDRCRSAVELLEASKAQYVKSSYVLEHRQQFGPAYTENNNTNNREKFHSRCIKENDIERSGSLPKAHRQDRKHRYSIGVCENIPRSAGRSVSVDGPSGKISDSRLAPSNKCDLTNSHSEPCQVSKVLDPGIEEGPSTMDSCRKTKGNGKLMSMHLSHNRCRELISASAALSGGKDTSLHSSMDLSDGLHRHKKAIHRSQSDISSRHSRSSADYSDLSSRISRTSADLERFFNEMGLDKAVIDPMLRKQSQSFSDFDFLDSLSLDSPDARSVCSGMCKSEKTGHSERESEGVEKTPPATTSTVERNARIIKWLCNVRKARSFASSTDTGTCEESVSSSIKK